MKCVALGPKTFDRHLLSRQQSKKKFKRNMLLALMLTPMVDMFSLLVIFLLQSFSTSPEQPLVPGLTLPSARNSEEVIDAPMLAIALDGVFLDSQRLGSLEEIQNNPTKLAQRLQHLREVWIRTHPEEKEFSGEINVQADRNLPSTLVSEIMGVLSSQAYGSYRLAVVGENPQL